MHYALSLGRIPISAIVVANPSGMILLYLAVLFFTPKVFLSENIYIYVAKRNFADDMANKCCIVRTLYQK